MSQATRPVAASPESQQLIDLCFDVAEGKMDVYPQLENAVSARQDALTQASDGFFASVESQPADFQQKHKVEIDLIGKYFESYDAALEQILKFKADPKKELLEESAHMLAFCSNGMPAAMSAYEQKLLSEGPHRYPLINVFTNLGKALREKRTSLEAWVGTCKQYDAFYTEALREVNASKKQEAAGVPERRKALENIVAALQEMEKFTPTTSGAKFEEVIQALADGHRDLDEAVAAYNREITSGPTGAPAINIILNAAEGVLAKQFQPRMLRDLCTAQIEATQEGIKEMQAVVKAPHESSVIQTETPKALEAMEGIEEALLAIVAYCDAQGSEEEVRAALRDLQDLTKEMLESKASLDSFSENYGKVLCPHCQTPNATSNKSCAKCNRVLPQMTGSELYGQTAGSFQALEGESVDTSRDGVITTTMKEVFDAYEDFKGEKMSLEGFLAVMDDYLDKTEDAKKKLSKYHAPPVPPEATEEERAKAQEFIDLCAEALELLAQGVEETEYGLTQMRDGASDDDNDKMVEGLRFYYEGSQKMWQVRRLDDALQKYIHADDSNAGEDDGYAQEDSADLA
ncbi:MAG: hypothetical protein KF760_17555 [Candidatus Eremiobacteraeota bacterium]|nr:hypothetical protein [Candidatus Eremiobacteraeota bacterium]MCW5870753.1 hypothetical protein [Candidatus Eremiobacteraeota bacterium]